MLSRPVVGSDLHTILQSSVTVTKLLFSMKKDATPFILNSWLVLPSLGAGLLESTTLLIVALSPD